MKHVTRRELEHFRVMVPDTKIEQQQIAGILSLVDRAIRQLESLITKYERIHRGLVHDLLLCGIDSVGRIRNSSTHKFKQSPFGLIPDEWECVQSQELCKDICVGIVIKPSQYYRESGVPTLRSANVREHGIVTKDLVFISEEANRVLSKSVLHEGYVVSVRTGYPGTSAVVPAELDGANCVDLVISKPRSKILPEYLAVWINSPFGKGQVFKAQGGLAQQHFNVSDMKKLLVVHPPAITEQQSILRLLKSQSGFVQLNVDTLGKLRRLRAGLMRDLLTGERPVEPLLKAETASLA